MVWETRRHEEEIYTLKSRIESLTSEASVASLQRVERESKLVELDHLIGQLLGVNETLVNQLSQRSLAPSASRATSANGTKKKRSLSAPRLAPSSDMAAAVRASKSVKEKKPVARVSSKVINGASGGGGLHDMHEMYVSLAKQITGKEASPTGLAQPGKKKRITSMKQRALKGKSTPPLPDDQSYTSSTMDSLSRRSMGSYPPPRPPSSTQELQGVIQSLEEEFELLNRQYQHLLQPKMGSSPAYGQEERSRELVSVIQRLHKKGEQLRALKSSPQKG
jgi:hypothetical protein